MPTHAITISISINQGKIWEKFFEVFMENGNFSLLDQHSTWVKMEALVLQIQEKCDRILNKKVQRDIHGITLN